MISWTVGEYQKNDSSLIVYKSHQKSEREYL